MEEDADFDILHAEHRARKIERMLGLDRERKGKECYQTGSPYMVEMNLFNASLPLKHLVDKIKRNILNPAVAAADTSKQGSLATTPGLKSIPTRSPAAASTTGKVRRVNKVVDFKSAASHQVHQIAEVEENQSS